MPADAVIRVKVGDRVKGGASIIATMADGAMAGGPREQKRSAAAAVEPEDEGDPR
jgi:hypothetical protein